MDDILSSLGIESVNPGAWTGASVQGFAGAPLESRSPANGRLLGQVEQAGGPRAVCHFVERFSRL